MTVHNTADTKTAGHVRLFEMMRDSKTTLPSAAQAKTGSKTSIDPEVGEALKARAIQSMTPQTRKS